MSNLETVQAIYLAFGRGDVAAMMEPISADADWEYGGDPDVPWLTPGRGQAAMAGFLAGLGGLDIHRFEVKALLEGEGLVVALVDLAATVKATGRGIVEVDEVHIWRFDQAGKVVGFRHRVDTHQHRVAAGAA